MIFAYNLKLYQNNLKLYQNCSETDLHSLSSPPKIVPQGHQPAQVMMMLCLQPTSIKTKQVKKSLSKISGCC